MNRCVSRTKKLQVNQYFAFQSILLKSLWHQIKIASKKLSAFKYAPLNTELQWRSGLSYAKE